MCNTIIKIALILFILLAFQMFTFAQKISGIGFYGGPSIVNIIQIIGGSKIYHIENDGPIYGIRYHFGSYVVLNKGNRWSFYPGLMYSVKGADRYNFIHISEKMSIHFISVPLIFSYKPVIKPLRIEAGFAIEYALSATDSRVPVPPYDALIDKSLIIGVGYEFSKNFGISARWFEALNTFNNHSFFKEKEAEKNQAYQISFHLILPKNDGK